MTRDLSIFVALIFVAGCDSDRLCTLEARTSVVVRVSYDGATVPDAVVSYSVDGDPFEPCEGDGSESFCGTEDRGLFRIRVEHPGFAISESEIEVGGDACHVQTERLDVALDVVTP